MMNRQATTDRDTRDEAQRARAEVGQAQTDTLFHAQQARFPTVTYRGKRIAGEAEWKLAIEDATLDDLRVLGRQLGFSV